VPFSRLFIWVEGRDDSRFFESCIKPLLKDKYDKVLVREYCQQPKDQIKKFISAPSERGHHIVFADIDGQLCVTAKKNQITRTRFGRVGTENVFVVVQEIESWYLAGLDAEGFAQLGLREIQSTDTLKKEQFDDLMDNSSFDSRVVFMQEILKLFSVEVAKEKNASFRYFANKLLPEAQSAESQND